MATATAIDKPDVVMVDDRSSINKPTDAENGRGQIHTIDNIRVLGLSDEDAEFCRRIGQHGKTLAWAKV